MSLLSRCCIVALIAIPCASAFSQPTMTVVPQSVNGNGNREWLVQVAPDASLFTGGGGSLAFELAFEIQGSNLVGAMKDGVNWPFDNPGNNPFTNSITRGTTIDTTGNTVFSSLGGGLFTTSTPLDTLVLETQGSGATTVNWGGHMLLQGTPQEYTGSRIAQAGMNFDSYIGTSSVVPEPTTLVFFIPIVALVARAKGPRRHRNESCA